MGKVWTKDEVLPSVVNGKIVELTDEQKQARVDEWNAYEAKSGERKLTKGFNLTKQAFENIALRLTGKDVDFLDLSDDNGNREGYFKFIRSFGQRLFRSKK